MQTYSILRESEDAHIARAVFTGKTIDLGGHKGSSYYRLLKSTLPVEVANMDSEIGKTHKTATGADHIFDLECPFPLASETYDHVLCLNVLEHIFNYQNVLSETARILKSGGDFYISVPFFFNIHGSPNDYFRYTKAALERLLTNAGFTVVAVHELGEGPCSAVFQNFGGSLPTQPLRIFVKHCAIFTDRMFSRISKKYRGIRTRVPLGYFVHARKL